MDNKESTFQYTYSAQEQSVVESIRQKYLPAEENKLERLRKLHNSAHQKAQICSIAVGVVGILIMGTGMSLVMTDLAAAWEGLAMVLGIVIGVVGMILVALAYPVYNLTLKKARERIAPEILRLSEELLK